MPDRPLLVTGDPLLLDDLLRLAAAAGVETEVAPGRRCRPAVLARRAARPGRRRPRRRPGPGRAAAPPGVLVVVRTDRRTRCLELAAAAGAESVHPLPGAEALLVDRLAGCRRPADRHRRGGRRRPRRCRRVDPGLRAGRGPAPGRRRCCSSTPTRWAAGSTCCSAPRRRRAALAATWRCRAAAPTRTSCGGPAGGRRGLGAVLAPR